MIILFDLDGVIIDTESHYTDFWDKAGKKYLGIDGFAQTVKGQAISWLLDRYFGDVSDKIDEIIEELDKFEATMVYEYIPGSQEFLKGLKERGIPFAIVTSSNESKMAVLRKVRPELWDLADVILTCEHFSNPKPAPDCFLLGMEMLGGRPEDTVVFEDSIHGINAGRSSGAYVVGLATSNSREMITPMCDMVIDDFRGFDIETIKLI